MKKSNKKKIRFGGLAVILCLLTSYLLSFTLAKFTSSVGGNGKAVNAAWSFKANDETATMTQINLSDTTNDDTTKLKSGTIAPGTSGQFDISVDPTGSETAVNYAITFGSATDIPTNLKFYSDLGHTVAYDLTSGFTGTINLPVGGIMTVDEKVTQTVYWDWPYYTDAAGDIADNANQNAEPSFTITVVGTQVEPDEAP